MNYRIFSLITLLLASEIAAADEVIPPKTISEKPADTVTTASKETLSETTHTIQLNGQPLTYKATTGTVLLKNSKGDPRASLFYVAYTKQGVEDLNKRPIAFCFNGGPGSSSIWLHIGAFGPKRLALKDDGQPIRPIHLTDNESTLLDFTDLVFIDPVSTGYSQVVPKGNDDKAFLEVDEDIKSIADFILLYTTRNNRWLSPRFLIGESYGTTRAAGLAYRLQEENYFSVNGIILISPALNFQTFSAQVGNDLPYVTFLPTFAGTAWYYKKLPKELQAKALPDLLKEVEQFAWNEYATGLLKGNSLSVAEKAQLIKKVATYTGLPERYVEQSNLRISMNHFAKKLLANEEKNIGYYDSRFSGEDLDRAGEYVRYDPSFETWVGPLTSAFNEYMRTALKYEKDEEYKILALQVFSQWDYAKTATNKFLNMGDHLRTAMIQDPHLHTFVASGTYDLATPYGAAVYTLNHLDLPEAVKKQLTFAVYPSGHMIYMLTAPRMQLRKDLQQFMNKAVSN